MLKLKFWMLSIFTISVLLVSCGETIDESQVLVDYLESTASPINVEKIPAYISAADLQSDLVAMKSVLILDIRGEAFSTIGHIAGAVDLAPGEVISYLDGIDVTVYDKMVITCVTGQTAAYVASLARMAGYPLSSLSYGMSSWNSLCATTLNTVSADPYLTQLETVSNDKAAEGALPVLSTGLETAEDILESQLTDVLADGFGAGAIDNSVVWADPSKYYIVNYWGATHYALGHITGAIQYTPNVDILSDEALKTLPADKTIVVYCYTGQTSAFLTAYLRVLGYDAKSLKFGMNGMATSLATEKGLGAHDLHAWDPASPIEGDLVK